MIWWCNKLFKHCNLLAETLCSNRVCRLDFNNCSGRHLHSSTSVKSMYEQSTEWVSVSMMHPHGLKLHRDNQATKNTIIGRKTTWDVKPETFIFYVQSML